MVNHNIPYPPKPLAPCLTGTLHDQAYARTHGQGFALPSAGLNGGDAATLSACDEEAEAEIHKRRQADAAAALRRIRADLAAQAERAQRLNAALATAVPEARAALNEAHDALRRMRPRPHTRGGEVLRRPVARTVPEFEPSRPQAMRVSCLLTLVISPFILSSPRFPCSSLVSSLPFCALLSQTTFVFLLVDSVKNQQSCITFHIYVYM